MNKSHHFSLEYVHSLWMLGEWHVLVKINEGLDKENPSYPYILLYIFSANLQILAKNNSVSILPKIQSIFEELQRLKVDKKKISSIIISGVQNNFGRALLINGEINKANNKFSQALKFFKGAESSWKMVNIRHQTQIAELAKHSKKIRFSATNLALESIQYIYPNEASVLIALAESAQQNQKTADAIRHWQNAAALMQNAMPQSYYDRLSQAYLAQRSFPQGTVEEEFLKGTIDKYEVLKHLHRALKPKKYLEIGVQTGKSLLLADCDAIGVDPMPYPNIKLNSNQKILKMTSDEFFKNHVDQYLKEPPDLVFIDGMHLFEFALRDFLNVERYASKNTVVLMDDIFPCHPAQAERERRTRAWTGDVWKVIEILEKYRKDLKIEKIDAYPTGIACISNFSAEQKNHELTDKDLIAEYKSKNMVPSSVMNRENSILWDNFLKLSGNYMRFE